MDYNIKCKSIFFFWAEVTGYLFATQREIIKSYNVSISILHWNTVNINSTKYKTIAYRGIHYYNKDKYTNDEILSILEKINPQIIVISAWMDKDYLIILRKYYKSHKNIIIVSGLDSQWKGNLKQIFGLFYFRIFYKKYFHFLWVSGKPQYVFARLLGYPYNKILSDLYSCDTSLFNAQSVFTKRFIFVGRFINVKFIKELVDTFLLLPYDIQKEWPLVLIGSGSELGYLKQRQTSHIHIHEFMQPGELQTELLKGGFAILPSIDEPWGVVVHEFATLGLPLLLSSACGSSTEFLIPGFNGFLFEAGNSESLYKYLNKISSLSTEECISMGNNSKILSCRISSMTSANTLMSVLYR